MVETGASPRMSCRTSLAAMLHILLAASRALNALWAVRIRLGARRNGWSTGSGSSTVTSSAAPAMAPASSAAMSAGSSTSAPRDVLMKKASGFIARNSAAPNMPAVSGVAGACTDTKSASRSRSRSDTLSTGKPESVASTGSYTSTRMSKPDSLRATARPI